MNDSTKKTKMYVIDGSSLIHRDFFASLPEQIRTEKDEDVKAQLYESLLLKCNGHYTDAISHFVSDILAIKYFQKPDYIAVCLDQSRSATLRRQAYAPYKAQRGSTPEPLKDQMNLVADICKELSIPVFQSPEYEADDYAGSIAKQLANPSNEVYLVTTDRDYFQLADDNISVCVMTYGQKYERLIETYGKSNVPIGTIKFTPEIIKAEIGVNPNQVTDWKGISGDPSDNIPGISGVSDKTAIPLLNKYGSLEKILEAVANEPEDSLKQQWKDIGIKRPSVKLFREGAEDARFFKELATIKTDLEVPTDLNIYDFKTSNEDFLQVSYKWDLHKPLNLFAELVEREMLTAEELEEAKSIAKSKANETIKESHVEEAQEELEEDFDIFSDF